MLTVFETLFNKLNNANGTWERVAVGKQLIFLITNCPEIAEEWVYRPEEFLWQDRFIKKVNVGKEVPTFYDARTNLKNAPNASGLYFFGNTAFNPETGEVQFWVKIGLGSNLHNRVKSYCTCNPSTFVIGYKETSNYANEEHQYHQLLEKVALYRNQNNTEWWMVDRETYLMMCKKSFDFFK